MFSMIASLNADLATLRRDTAAAKEHHDPRVVANLERQAQAAQQRVDTLSHELLAITMAPQVAQQLREWYGTKEQKIRDLHNGQWEESVHWRENHPNDSDDRNKAWKYWDDAIEKEEQSSREELSRMLANADFIRKELFQRISPQQQSAEDKKQEKEFAQTDSDQRSLEKAAAYLEELARRVPPPPK